MHTLKHYQCLQYLKICNVKKNKDFLKENAYIKVKSDLDVQTPIQYRNQNNVHYTRLYLNFADMKYRILKLIGLFLTCFQDF